MLSSKNNCIKGLLTCQRWGDGIHTTNTDGEMAVDTESRIPNCVGGQYSQLAVRKLLDFLGSLVELYSST